MTPGLDDALEERLARFVEHHVLHGERLPLEPLCSDRPELAGPLRALVDQYLSLTSSLSGGPIDPTAAAPTTAALPVFEGFQTIERLGGGGMGEVYKLKDLTLDRIVAGKIVRPDRRMTGVAGFLQEAKAMALFSDRRIVRIFEFRDGDPALIVMEYVEGFELGRIGPSLEFAQRGRVLAEICDAVHHAHGLGIQHRDLKPSNIMVDAALLPRILDFGLSAGDPRTGHLKGTVRYIAPEQLDPSQPIDARTDVYALGVILYELLAGRAPYEGGSDQEIVDAIRAGHPRLPIEIDPRIPEPLQAIAVKGMERAPGLRYQTAQDMALDLRRFIAGRPVLARPSVYASTLGTRTGAHLQHITEWLQLRLIHPHEADRLRRAYATLDARDEDWIVESRALSYTQISLYLGAFLLVCGSLFYFVANRWYQAVQGIARPLAVLGLPFIGLNLAARHFYRRDHKVVAVAFYLAAVGMLPLLLMILFDETGFLVAPHGAPNQLFPDGSVSNHQLQVTTLVACVWCGVLALSTRTMAMSTVFAMLAFVFGLSVAADFGLRSWIEDQRWDSLALHLAPLVAVYGVMGAAADRLGRGWLSRPLYRGAALLLMVLMELLALHGRTFHYLGFSLEAWQSATVSDPHRLDTVAAMTLNGLAIYAIAAVLRRRGTELMAGTAGLLFAVSPFAMLQPLAYLVRTGEYSLRYDWIYLGLALAVTLLSERRQRKSFYYAGLSNTGAALYLISEHRHWFDRPSWGVTLILVGLLSLVTGFALDRQARTARS
ncbi:MAG: serine/threonine-protein kinase [Vicinamibacterales bacterium]